MNHSLRVVRSGAWVLAACVLVACSRPEPPQEPVRSVKVMTVGSQLPEFRTEYAGEVRARNEVRLGFRVGGKLVARPAEVGQRVKGGQVLAQLDAADYQLASQAAQAQVQAATTQRDLAAADFKRYTELRAQNFISSAELERRETTLKAAQASLDQAKAQGGVQSNQKGYAVLVAERAGVVLAVEAEPGQVVSAGAPVVRVAEDGPRDVVIAVPEHKAAGLRAGLPASVRLWASDATHSAVVREVAASADAVTRTFAVKLALQGEQAAAAALGSTAYVQLQSLPAGSLASAQQQASAAPGLIKVPTGALWQQGQGSAVWLFDAASGSVKAQPVVVATADGNQAVIASGLKGGEQVVVAGVHVLTDGQKVNLFKEKNVPAQVSGADQLAAKTENQPAVVAPAPAKGQP